MHEIKEKINIKDMIYEVRGKQVMLDSDLAKLYGCTNGTKDINKAVKRNIERFPDNFYFQLSEQEALEISRFQFGTLNKNGDNRGYNLKYLPYVFTEQGVAMLSSVLRTKDAARISVSIMNAFVEMRKFINENKDVFKRLTTVEYKMLEYDENFEKIFEALEPKKIEKQKIFFEGQIYDAYSLIIDLIKQANNRIVIIDNYVDKSMLDILTYKKDKVDVKLVMHIRNLTNLDINKFNSEYPNLKIKYSNVFHDRFLIIDNTLYHIGASLKDLGKKCFGINVIEDKEYLKKILEVLKCMK